MVDITNIIKMRDEIESNEEGEISLGSQSYGRENARLSNNSQRKSTGSWHCWDHYL